MEVYEIKKLKSKLVSDIENLVAEFERNTGATVSSIETSRIPMFTGYDISGAIPNNIVVYVRLEI